MSPTQRSLAYLRAQGYIVAVVEQTVPKTFIKRDLFGFADLLAIKPGKLNLAEFASRWELPMPDDDELAEDPPIGRIILIQVTSSSNVAARRTKIAAEPRASLWKQAGGEIHLHGWSKKGPRGKRKVWSVNVEEM